MKRIKGIERKEQVEIIVNGKKISAYRGETLAAALWAAGYKRFGGKALKGRYNSPFCGMGVCFECLVTVNGVPNIRSCMTLVEEGMEVEFDDE